MCCQRRIGQINTAFRFVLLCPTRRCASFISAECSVNFLGVFKEGEDMEPIMEQDVVLSRIICCYICCAYV